MDSNVELTVVKMRMLMFFANLKAAIPGTDYVKIKNNRRMWDISTVWVA
jgi:hypothetical protein